MAKQAKYIARESGVCGYILPRATSAPARSSVVLYVHFVVDAVHDVNVRTALSRRGPCRLVVVTK